VRSKLVDLVCAALVVAACHELDLGEAHGTACRTKDDCRAPYLCHDGSCQNPCSTNGDCDAGTCVQVDSQTNVCQADAGAAGRGHAGSRGDSGPNAGGPGELGSAGAAGGDAGTGGASSNCHPNDQCSGGDPCAAGSCNSETGRSGGVGGSLGGLGGSGGTFGGSGGTTVPGMGGSGGQLSAAGDGGGVPPESGNAGAGETHGACTGTLTFDAVPAIGVPGPSCSVELADVNGDSLLDLTVGQCGNGGIEVLLGKGGGAFEYSATYGVGATYGSHAVGDIDGDERPDIVAATNAGNVAVLKNKGGGKFEAASYYPAGTQTMSIALADLDQDGDVDVAVGNLESPELIILMNLGDGTFADGEEYDGPGDVAFRIAAGDLNGDHVPDLVSVGDNTVRIALNPGNGVFATQSSVQVGDTLMCVALADFNRDGQLDIATTPVDSADASVLLNQGGGSFSTVMSYAYSTNDGVIAPDMDGDGNPDLVFTGLYQGTAHVLLNRFPDRKFSEFITVPGAQTANAVAAGDLDGDGLPDLVLSYPNENNIAVLLTRCAAN
jgi:hypothetical protein